MTDRDEDELETFIDEHGLLRTIAAIQRICRKKEEHIRTNWQADRLADEWVKIYAHIEALRIELKPFA